MQRKQHIMKRLHLFDTNIKEKFIMKKHYRQNALWIAYYEERVAKMQCLGKLLQVLIKFISETFPN